MSNLNQFAISGNACADPEFKQISDTFAVAKFRVAVNRSKKAADGNGYEEVVSFFDVEVLGNYAALIDKKVRRGDKISLTGRLEQQRWEQEGQQRSKVVLIADQVDGDCFYKKADQVAPKAASSTSSGATGSSSDVTGTDDDIPF